jgi:hypothetical protein
MLPSAVEPIAVSASPPPPPAWAPPAPPEAVLGWAPPEPDAPAADPSTGVAECDPHALAHANSADTSRAVLSRRTFARKLECLTAKQVLMLVMITQ